MPDDCRPDSGQLLRSLKQAGDSGRGKLKIFFGYAAGVGKTYAMLEAARRAKAAGVDSFWYKDISPEALIDVIDRTMAGEHLFPGETPKVQLGLVESTELTAKEIEVLRLICDGLEYDEIAGRLDVAERTVKYHVSNILSKTGYANRTRLAIAVTNKKFIVPNLPEEQEFSKTE